MNKKYTSNEKNDCSNPKDNRRKFKILNLIYKIFVAVGIVAIILLILFKPCTCKCDCAKSSSQSTYFDTTVDDSVSDEKTESAVSDLNKQVEDGMITMSMNADPSFEFRLSFAV